MVSTGIRWLRNVWFFLTTFFPVQLFFLHLRRSHLLIIFWLLLFGFVSGFLAESYGFRYLFLTPEYLDKVNFLSYFIVGMTAGLFIVAFHINSYIYYGYRFPFLATLSRPLWKFSLNNSILPLIFYLFYLWNIADFLVEEGISTSNIAIRISGLVLGSIIMVGSTFTYFFTTLRSLELPDEKGPKRTRAIHNLAEIFGTGARKPRQGKSPINFYLSRPFSVKIARHSQHYKREVLMDTIGQHHFSASVFFMLLIIVTILLGLVSDIRSFMIPAGATVFVIFSLYLMVVGAFYTRLKTWTVTVGILALLILNYMSGFERFRTTNYAFGMDYGTQPASYSYATMDSITSPNIVSDDLIEEEKVLERWKEQTGRKKPPMVILNVSGGGQRSAVWAMKVLQEADSLSNGDLYRLTHLITGSSGGMLGAAFYREAKYRHAKGEFDIHPYSPELQRLMAMDLLNPTCFTLAVNDLFFRVKRVDYEGRSYPLDRGYSFDRKLASNTLGVLDRRFIDYQDLERSGLMPTMILGPSVVGDGRKLLMASRGISYLTFTRPGPGVYKDKEYDGVEFRRLFRNQDADSLSFLTALRLSASFPYITPLVNMPSEPGIELIDAGVRDNEGFELALRYIFQHRKWIEENTAGVVVLQIKANRPNEIPIADGPVTRLDRLTRPIGGVFTSFHNFQVYNKSMLMQYSREELKLPIEIVRFLLFDSDKDRVSLSWHLTNMEKERIQSTFENDLNQDALEKLNLLIRKSR
jgi:hypothetical protein